MSDPRHALVREVFAGAMALADEERRAYLEERCGDDSELRREVGELLELHERPEATSAERLRALEKSLRGGDDAEALPEIPDYEVLRRLGEGGMGTVYEAEQRRPVRRTVAIKLLKRGLDSRRIVGRFEAERQALAVMSHANIARVFDAGESLDGRPFFAMELVEGEPITAFCDRRRFAAADRLRLFVTACEAVQHAHQKGIVHRDLKPSNLLVESQEGRPVVKVIDFGIAKALHADAAEQAPFTEHGQFLGTPEYMSPEQADLGPDVDTRTDVYSLGVVLFELLTGTLPLHAEPGGGPRLGALRRAIREGETPRPSTRVSTLGDEARSIAARRRTDVSGLARLLRQDLDWITLRALDKDRERRYPSASELGADVERHLRCEPVVAGPPTALYRLQKLVSRHRFAFATALALSVAVLLGLIGTSFGMLRARRAEQEARQQTRTASEVARFLVEIFQTSNPYDKGEEELSARELLERGARRIEDELEEDPEIRAALMRALGQVYDGLGMYGESERLLEKAVQILRRVEGENGPQLAATTLTLAWVYRSQGRLAEAEPLLERAIEVLEGTTGANTADLAQAHQVLGIILRDRGELDRGRRHLKKSLALREQDPDSPGRGAGLSLYHLGWLENLDGHYEEAEDLYQRAMAILASELGPDHPLVGWCHNDLGAVLSNLGRLEAARAHYARALEIQEKALGPEHPGLAAPLQNLGSLLGRLGLGDEAMRHLQRAVEIREAALGPDHPELAASLGAVGFELWRQVRHQKALAHYERALAILRNSLGPESSQYAVQLNILGGLLQSMGELDRSRRLIEEALDVMERSLGPDHPGLAHVLSNLATLDQQVYDFGAMARSLERAVDLRQRAFPDSDAVAWTLCRLGDAYGNRGLEARGREAFERAAKIIAGLAGDSADYVPAKLDCGMSRARFEARLGHREAAAPFIRQALALLEAHPEKETAFMVQQRASYWALLGERRRAIEELRRAIDLGLRNPTLVHDPDFESLLGDPAFEELAARAASAGKCC